MHFVLESHKREDRSGDVNPYIAPLTHSVAPGTRSAANRSAIGTRVIASLLALSGLEPASLAWFFPFFWPGYIVWIGWILIATGVSRANRTLFWGFSIGWNLFVAVFLFSDTDWSFNNKAFGYVHARLHTAAACVLSVAALVLLMLNTRSVESNAFDQEAS